MRMTYNPSHDECNAPDTLDAPPAQYRRRTADSLRGATIRLFFFLLVLANLVFFVWTQGYLGAADDGHEPQRLSQQLHAEKLRITRDAQASAAKPVELACRVINGLKPVEADTLKAAVEAAGGEAKVLPLAEATRHLVLIADLANKAAADKKSAELTRFGVEGHSAVALEEGRYEVVLGSFDNEAAARSLLQGLIKRGVKSARVDAREPPPLKARVEARAEAAILLPQLPKLIAPFADATIGECPP